MQTPHASDSNAARRRRAAGLRTAIVWLTVVVAGAAGWNGLPDWAADWADRAPKVPDGVPKHIERALFRERLIIVRSDGSVEERYRVVRQFLSARAEIALFLAPFSSRSKIERVRMWHLPPGRTARSANEDLEVVIDPTSAESMARRVRVAGLERGSLVFGEATRSQRSPLGLAFGESFHGPHPILRSDVVLRVPVGWNVRHEWLHRSGPAPDLINDEYRFTMTDLEPLEEEKLSPPAVERAPLLVVGVTPPDRAHVKPTFETWAAVGRWYDELVQGRSTAGPGVSAETARTGSVPALAALVRDRVRHVPKDVAVDGYRPRAAEETLASRHGDSKDKANLLCTLLTQAGHESYPVLVPMERNLGVPQSIPILGAFDRMIVAVKADDPTAERYPGAIVRLPDLGPFVLVDPTTENVAFGTIPSALEGRQGLLLAGARTTLIDLPVVSPDGHAIRATAELALGPDGSVHVDARCTYRGQPAADRRERLRASSAEYRDAWTERLQETWIDAVVQSFEVEAENQNGELVEVAKFRVPRAIGEPRMRVPLFGGLGPFLPEPPLGRRETPVRYPHRARIDFVATLHGLKDEAITPAATDEQGPGFHVTASFERTGDRLRASGTIVLDRTEFALNEVPELKRFLRATDRLGETAVALVP